MSPSEMVRMFAFSHSFALTSTTAKSMEEKLQPKVRKSLKLHTALLHLANQLLQATVSSKPLMFQAKKYPSGASARCSGRKIKHSSTLHHPSHLIPLEKLVRSFQSAYLLLSRDLKASCLSLNYCRVVEQQF